MIAVLIALASPWSFAAEADAPPCIGASEFASASADELFDSALDCDDQVGAVLLMIVGQVRAISDLASLPPDGEAAEQAAGELYGRVFYQMGGSGPDVIYRDQELYQSLLRQLAAWSPAPLDEYDPGWESQTRPSDSEYRSLVESQKSRRVRQLDEYHRWLNDPEYFERHEERNEILRRNGNRLVEGTEDAERANELGEEMSRIRDRISREAGG